MSAGAGRIAAGAAMLLLGAYCAADPIAERPREPEVVVYGGTSGGVMAAVQAARLGRTVVLIEPTGHVGGMSASGIGLTDVGVPGTIGGLAREFYGRVHRHYTRAEAWRSEGRAEFFRWMPRHWGVDGPTADRLGLMFLFEPRVAESIFDEMLREAGVSVVRRERLDLVQGVGAVDGRIAHIRMESGRTVSGRVFVDATYEGDLMARAGVRYTVGREGNAQYGEVYNGVRPRSSLLVDPYVVPRSRTSGLLPAVTHELSAAAGDGDDRVQSYCFRLCLTDVAENLVPITKPARYDEARFELLGRYCERHPGMRPGRDDAGFAALFGDGEHMFFTLSRLPNRKTDSNAGGPFALDVVGLSHAWPEADHAIRERLWQEHKDVTQGVLWFAGNDPRVPGAVRAEVRRWGLARDEFVDNDNWPYRLYVREARRMVSDYVATDHDVRGLRRAGDGVALASYPADSHTVQYFIGPDRRTVWSEGDLWAADTVVFPVSYRSIRPRAGECRNLLVPAAVSASHAAFGSLRMEPVFMMLGQAAGAAAAQSLDDGVDVQDVSYPRLRRTLLDAGQKLELPN